MTSCGSSKEDRLAYLKEALARNKAKRDEEKRIAEEERKRKLEKKRRKALPKEKRPKCAQIRIPVHEKAVKQLLAAHPGKYDAESAALILGISAATVRRHAPAGTLVYVKGKGKLSEDSVRKMIADGASLADIVAATGCRHSTVRAFCEEKGIVAPTKEMSYALRYKTLDRDIAVVRRTNANLSLAELARMFNRDKKLIVSSTKRYAEYARSVHADNTPPAPLEYETKQRWHISDEEREAIRVRLFDNKENVHVVATAYGTVASVLRREFPDLPLERAESKEAIDPAVLKTLVQQDNLSDAEIGARLKRSAESVHHFRLAYSLGSACPALRAMVLMKEVDAEIDRVLKVHRSALATARVLGISVNEVRKAISRNIERSKPCSIFSSSYPSSTSASETTSTGTSSITSHTPIKTETTSPSDAQSGAQEDTSTEQE